MHGERTSSQSMINDDINTNTSTSIESACLPIGCSVSAKYRGAFCSAQVKTIDRQVKLKLILLDTNDVITISEEQVVRPVPLRIGNTITIRLPSTNRHESRSGLAAMINSHDEKQAIIKQIYDNSIYTVVFNDGDEKSLRRSSLCLQGIRLYQQKALEDIPTPSSSTTISTDTNDLTSIVAIRRNGNNNQHVFPGLILKRKALADYIWIKSFLDGKEYIVHKRDDVQPYKNNSDIQSLCRLTSKQATKACEKFIKHNQIPTVWQKKKKKQLNNDYNEDKNINDNDLNTSESDVDDTDEDRTEEKDSFVAQLFAFMDDRGTPINNIPKVQKYDLDLHRLFKIVRMLGGYNKVTKNDQWGKVYIKMGLPDESSTKNVRTIEHAYKKYLFAYEDLSKKLGTMNAPNAYFGGRTSMSSDSRRSLVRVRQQSEDKNKLKQQTRKRLSLDSKATLSSTSKTPRRKTIIINKIKSSSTSESETSDNESSSSNNKIKKQLTKKTKKPPINSDEAKIIPTFERSNSVPNKKSKSTNDIENNMKPVIKIPKISYEILKESTLAIQHKFHKRQTSTTTSDQQQQAKTSSIRSTETIKSTVLPDLTPLQVTPVSPSPPPSITDESSTVPSLLPKTETVNNDVSEVKALEAPSIFHTILSSPSISDNETKNLPSHTNKRSYSDENSEYNYKIDEQLSPSKRSRSSQDTNDIISNRLTYEDILVNDMLLVRRNLNRKKLSTAKCIEKNNQKKELRVHYKGLDSKHDEWIEFDRVIKRQDEPDSTEEEIIINISTSLTTTDENAQEKNISNDQDHGIWKSLEIVSLHEDGVVSCSTNNQGYHPMCILPSSSIEYSAGSHENVTSLTINNRFESTDDEQPILQRRYSLIKTDSLQSINIDDIPSTADNYENLLHIKEEIIEISSTTPIISSLPSNIIPNSPPDNRRASTRQQRRRTFRDSKDSSTSTKKRTRLDTDNNSNYNHDNINNSDLMSIPIEQQSAESIKRYRTVGRRGPKRTVNQQDNEHEDSHLNSPINGSIRQQLEDMFKHRSSRYNFLDLNNNLTGENRLSHLKDHMRQCQKVFFNLKSALTKIEKQRKIYLRRQKSLIAQPTANELILPSTCT